MHTSVSCGTIWSSSSQCSGIRPSKSTLPITSAMTSGSCLTRLFAKTNKNNNNYKNIIISNAPIPLVLLESKSSTSFLTG